MIKTRALDEKEACGILELQLGGSSKPFLAFFIRCLFVFATYHDKIAILVTHTAVARPWWRHRPIRVHHYFSEAGVVPRNVVIRLHRVDFKLIQVIEENTFTFTLASEHVDVIVDDAGGVAIA